MINSINKSELEALIKKTENKTIVLDFYAPWCEPCTLFAPILEKISVAFEDDAIFAKINIDEEQSLAVTYQVTSIPTLIILRNKEEAWRHVGSLPEELLMKKLEEHI